MAFLPRLSVELTGLTALCYIEAHQRLIETCPNEKAARELTEKTFKEGVARTVEEKVKEFSSFNWFVAFFWIDESFDYPKTPPQPSVDLCCCRLPGPDQHYATFTFYTFKRSGLCNERNGLMSSDNLPVLAAEEAHRLRFPALAAYLSALPPTLAEGTIIPWLN